MDQPEPIPDEQPRRTGWRTYMMMALVLFGMGVAATVAALWYSGFGPAPKTATLTLPVASGPDGPQTPVVIVQAKGAAPAPTIDLNALAAREAALSARLTDLETRTASVSADAQTAAGNASRAEGMLIAFAARRALDRGGQLGYLQEQLVNRFGAVEPRAVATVLQAARDPVTLVDLRTGLDMAGPDLMTGGLDHGLVVAVRRALTNLIVIRRAETPSPLPSNRLKRARQLVGSGQVDAALAEVARMPGAGRATRWIAAARRYVAARSALDAIESAAMLGRTAMALPAQAAAAAPVPAPSPSSTPATVPATVPAPAPAASAKP